MSRYIYAEWLMKYFERGKEYKGEYVLDDLKYDAPSIDIVRCSECKYKQQCHKAVEHITHEPTSVTIGYKSVDFCSYGERQTERSE